MSSAPSVPSSGALISHLVSRIESDLSFLASHNLLTASELAQIKSSLLEAQTRANGAALELLAVRNGDAQPAGLATQQAANAAPAVTKQQCKAVWDYSKAQVSYFSLCSRLYSCSWTCHHAERGGARSSPSDSDRFTPDYCLHADSTSIVRSLMTSPSAPETSSQSR